MSDDTAFTPDQQEYLKGFMAGVEARRAVIGQPLAPVEAPTSDPHRAAQDRTVAAGGKLTAEEEAKRKKHPLDRFDEIGAMAAEPRFPKGTDIFLGKFFGLFYVAPAQNAYMCRLRIPGGILNAHQFRGVASIAEDLGGGYADITTRANLQIREIGPDKPPEVLMRLAEIGLTSRGAGADNIRNITGSPTAGIDPQELIDTRPHAGRCITSSCTTASSMACRASSTSPSTAADASRCWRTPTTSHSARCMCRTGSVFRPAFTIAWVSAASPAIATSPVPPMSSCGRRTQRALPTLCCACSSPRATAPTAPRRG